MTPTGASNPQSHTYAKGLDVVYEGRVTLEVGRAFEYRPTTYTMRGLS